MHFCRKCHTMKPYSEFHSSTRDGIQFHCKDCKRILNRRYQEYKNTWMKNHPEIRERYNQSSGAKEYQDKYRQTDRFKSILKNSLHKRRSQIKETDITADWLSELKIATNRCPWCGEWRPNHLDHIIPLSDGGTHTKDNVRYLCAHCNLTRPRRMMNEWGQTTQYSIWTS